MVPLDGRLRLGPRGGAVLVDVRDDGAPQSRGQQSRDAIPVILGMPVEFMRVLDELAAADSSDDAHDHLHEFRHMAPGTRPPVRE